MASGLNNEGGIGRWMLMVDSVWEAGCLIGVIVEGETAGDGKRMIIEKG